MIVLSGWSKQLGHYLVIPSRLAANYFLLYSKNDFPTYVLDIGVYRNELEKRYINAFQDYYYHQFGLSPTKCFRSFLEIFYEITSSFFNNTLSLRFRREAVILNSRTIIQSSILVFLKL